MSDNSKLEGYEPVPIAFYVKGKGKVLETLPLLTFQKASEKILVYGKNAQKYWESSQEKYMGSDNEGISTICPLRFGMIADYVVAVKLFQLFLREVWGKRSLFRRKPWVVVAIPKNPTNIEIRAYEDAWIQAGAGKITITEYTPEKVKQFEKEYKAADIFVEIIQDFQQHRNKEPIPVSIYIKNKGKVLEEPSLIAYETQTNKIVAVGSEASQYQWKEPVQDAKKDTANEILVFSPLVNGVIADFEAAQKMFQEILNRGLGPKKLFNRRKKLAFCVPKELTQVEKKAFHDAFLPFVPGGFTLLEFSYADAMHDMGDLEKEIGKLDVFVEIGET